MNCVLSLSSKIRVLHEIDEVQISGLHPYVQGVANSQFYCSQHQNMNVQKMICTQKSFWNSYHFLKLQCLNSSRIELAEIISIAEGISHDKLMTSLTPQRELLMVWAAPEQGKEGSAIWLKSFHSPMAFSVQYRSRGTNVPLILPSAESLKL